MSNMKKKTMLKINPKKRKKTSAPASEVAAEKEGVV